MRISDWSSDVCSSDLCLLLSVFKQVACLRAAGMLIAYKLLRNMLMPAAAPFQETAMNLPNRYSSPPIINLSRLRAHVPEPPAHDPSIPPDIPPPDEPGKEVDLPPREEPDDIRDPAHPDSRQAGR